MKLKLSHEYMSESYDQARRYGSKWLLIERFVATGLIILGVTLSTYANGKTIMPIILIMMGVFEFFSNTIKKYFWLRRHSKSKLMDAQVELKVTDTGIDTSGPFSNGHTEWDGIEKTVRTPKGILVWPQKGIYWYLPENIAGKEVIDLIEEKAS